MNVKRYRCALALAFLVTTLASVASAAPSFPVRNPQVALNGTELQNYFNGLGEAINVYTDQLQAQTYVHSMSGNSGMTIMIELAGNADQNTLGIYDATVASPTLYQVFPGAAAARWSAMVSFLASGDIVVNLFDNNAILQGTTTYSGANVDSVGFYLEGPGGTFYSEDRRNGGDPQALMFQGTGQNFGDFWVCWEDLHFNAGSDQDFNDEVLLIQSFAPVPASPATWGKIKAQYH